MSEEFLPRLTLLLLVLLAISMVQGATRANSLLGVVRESLRGLVALTGGFALLVLCVELVLLVVQPR